MNGYAVHHHGDAGSVERQWQAARRVLKNGSPGIGQARSRHDEDTARRDPIIRGPFGNGAGVVQDLRDGWRHGQGTEGKGQQENSYCRKPGRLSLTHGKDLSLVSFVSRSLCAPGEKFLPEAWPWPGARKSSEISGSPAALAGRLVRCSHAL